MTSFNFFPYPPPPADTRPEIEERERAAMAAHRVWFALPDAIVAGMDRTFVVGSYSRPSVASRRLAPEYEQEIFRLLSHEYKSIDPSALATQVCCMTLDFEDGLKVWAKIAVEVFDEPFRH